MRRIFRRHKRQVEDISIAADEHLDKHVIRRLMRLVQVRRFLVGWLCLVAVLVVGVVLQTRALGSHYQKPTPTAGGTFTEGIVGTFTNANPLYATGSADASVSRLVFAGLYKYDDQSKLVPDLAEKMSFDESQNLYTVKLKPNLKWQDGYPLTAKDVAFTYAMIQNPDARSYLQSSWRGIKVVAVDDLTVTFTLPSKLSAFPYSLTNGLIPQHVLAKVSPDQLRSSNFNTAKPVGAGPFKLDKVEVDGDSNKREERIGLIAFDGYHSGSPKLSRFVVKTFRSEEPMVESYSKKQIDAMASLSTLPDQFSSDVTTREYSPVVMGEVMVFFKTTQTPLNDVAVRNALTLATNKQNLLSQLPYALAVADGPLLKSHVGYSKQYAQKTNDVAQANALLDAAGWVRDPKTNIRMKDGRQLTFRLVSQTNSEYASVTQSLQKQWEAIGVNVQVSLQGEQELQTTVALHSYDALLYAISLGPDPDVFAYWHSSQADVRSETRLNFSEYQSTAANGSLEAGRTRTDPVIRATKYQPFLQAWQKDAPAIALYQPRFLYVVRTPFYGFNVQSVVSATDRYSNVENWMIREQNRY